MKVTLPDNSEYDIETLVINKPVIEFATDCGRHSWLPSEITVKNDITSHTFIGKQLLNQFQNRDVAANYKFKYTHDDYEVIGCFILDVKYQEDVIKLKIVMDYASII